MADSNSRFKLFTLGLFRVTVEMPVLSLTSTRTRSCAVAVDWHLTMLDVMHFELLKLATLASFKKRDGNIVSLLKNGIGL